MNDISFEDCKRTLAEIIIFFYTFDFCFSFSN